MKRVCIFEMGPEDLLSAHTTLDFYDYVVADPMVLMLAESMLSQCQLVPAGELTDNPECLKNARVVIICSQENAFTPQWAYSAGAGEAVVCQVSAESNSLEHSLMRAWARGQPLPRNSDLDIAIAELKSESYQSLPDAGLSDGEGGTQYDEDGRKGKQRGIPISGVVAEALQQVAESFAGRPLACEALHLMAYRTGDHFLPHTDEYLPDEVLHHGMPDRRVSISLELSDESEYRDGCLRMFAAGSFHDTPKRQGWVTVFCSDVTHEVVEVTDGERRAVVGWYTHA